jgi:hypothetical protein
MERDAGQTGSGKKLRSHHNMMPLRAVTVETFAGFGPIMFVLINGER